MEKTMKSLAGVVLVVSYLYGSTLAFTSNENQDLTGRTSGNVEPSFQGIFGYPPQQQSAHDIVLPIIPTNSNPLTIRRRPVLTREKPVHRVHKRPLPGTTTDPNIQSSGNLKPNVSAKLNAAPTDDAWDGWSADFPHTAKTTKKAVKGTSTVAHATTVAKAKVNATHPRAVMKKNESVVDVSWTLPEESRWKPTVLITSTSGHASSQMDIPQKGTQKVNQKVNQTSQVQELPRKNATENVVVPSAEIHAVSNSSTIPPKTINEVFAYVPPPKISVYQFSLPAAERTDIDESEEPNSESEWSLEEESPYAHTDVMSLSRPRYAPEEQSEFFIDSAPTNRKRSLWMLLSREPRRPAFNNKADLVEPITSYRPLHWQYNYAERTAPEKLVDLDIRNDKVDRFACCE